MNRVFELFLQYKIFNQKIYAERKASRSESY